MKRFLKPPVFSSPEFTEQARMLHTVALGTMAACIVFFLTLAALVQPEVAGRALILGIAANGVCVVAIALARRALIRPASWLLVISLIAIILGSAITAGGVRSPGIMALCTLVLAAGLLLGERSGLIVGGIGALAGLTLVLADYAGVLPPAMVSYTAPALWAISCLYIAVVVTLQRLALRRSCGGQFRQVLCGDKGFILIRGRLVPRRHLAWGESIIMVHRMVLPAFAVAIVLGCASDSVETNAAGDTILRDIACNTCSIAADSVAFLGHPDDTLSLRLGNVPAVDSRGNFYVADARGAAVLVLRPNGRLLTTFGRGGEGPGEFERASRVFVGKGDTLYVQGSNWIYVVSPQHQHLRQFQNPRPVGGAGGMFAFIGTILSDGRLLLSSRQNGMVLIDHEGVVSPHIDLAGLDSGAAVCGDCGPRAFREANEPGTVWSAPHNSYRVEQHDLSGKLLRRFIRIADWYPDWDAAQLRNSEDPISFFAKPRVWGVRQGTDGILWTHIVQLENPESFRATWNMQSPSAPQELIGSLSTRIEAIDVARKRLLGGIKLNGVVMPMMGDQAAHVVSDGEGGWGWKIVRFRVLRG